MISSTFFSKRIINRLLSMFLMLMLVTSFHVHKGFAQEIGVSNTTFTPKSLLHVHDNNATGQMFQLTNTTSGNGATTNGFVFDFEASFKAAFKNQYENASAGISFYTYTNGGALTEKLIIQNNGYVGIGTSSPETKLHISGDNRASSTFFTSRFSADAFGPYLDFSKSRDATIGTHTVVQNGDVLGYIRFQGSVGGGFENAAVIRGVVDGVPSGGNVNGELQFRTSIGGTDEVRMILRASGHVGINTLSPDDRLEVYDTDADAAVSIQRESNDEFGSYLNFKKTRGGIVSDDDILGTIRFQGYDTDTWANAAQIRGYSDGTPGDGDMPGRLSFHTSPDGSETVVERMRIDNAGNIGIGNDNPSKILDITSTASGVLLPRMTNAQILALTGVEGEIVYQIDGSSGYYYNDGATWQKYSNTSISGWPTTGAAGTNAATHFVGTTDAVDLVFRTNNTEEMRLESGGNLGIGNNNPAYLLDILGDGTVPLGYIYNGSAAGDEVKAQFTDDQFAVYGKFDDDDYTADNSISGWFINDNDDITTANTKYSIYANTSGTSGTTAGHDKYGVYSKATGSGDKNYGVYGFSGDGDLCYGSYGSSGGTGNTYGIRGYSSGTGPEALGGKFSTSGAATTAWGIWAEAKGATTNIAGYFELEEASVNPIIKLYQADAGGDASLSFETNGGNQFIIGIDADDSDMFKISDNTGLGTNDRLIIDSEGHVGIGVDPASFCRLNVLKEGTSDIASSFYTLYAKNNETYNTSAASRFAYGIYGHSTATEGTGGNGLYNIGVYGRAEGGDINFAGYFTTDEATSYPTVFVRNNNGGGDASMIFFNTTKNYTIGVDGSDGDIFKISDNDELGTNDRFVIDAAGEVGIGTTAPATLLELSATDAPELRITSTGGTKNPALVLKRESNASSDWKMHNSGGTLYFARSVDDCANWTNAIYIASTPKIATSSASADLTLGGGDDIVFQTYNGSWTETMRLYDNGNLDVTGDLDVVGTLSKGGGTFKIDHPLDPENKYLYHSFVESPDMMNIYNGNITTNENGDAIVTLPDYFNALNMEFRYQLTVIGSFAQAIILKEISGNNFTVKTDKPNIKVSWQVTGIRKDPWANKNRVVPEVEKEDYAKGKYLYPELLKKSKEFKIKKPKKKEKKDNTKIETTTEEKNEIPENNKTIKTEKLIKQKTKSKLNILLEDDQLPNGKQ